MPRMRCTARKSTVAPPAPPAPPVQIPPPPPPRPVVERDYHFEGYGRMYRAEIRRARGLQIDTTLGYRPSARELSLQHRLEVATSEIRRLSSVATRQACTILSHRIDRRQRALRVIPRVRDYPGIRLRVMDDLSYVTTDESDLELSDVPPPRFDSDSDSYAPLGPGPDGAESSAAAEARAARLAGQAPVAPPLAPVPEIVPVLIPPIAPEVEVAPIPAPPIVPEHDMDGLGDFDDGYMADFDPSEHFEDDYISLGIRSPSPYYTPATPPPEPAEPASPSLVMWTPERDPIPVISLSSD